MSESKAIEILDVVIVLKSECAQRFAETVANLRKFGLVVESQDQDNGVIEGTLPADKLAEVRENPCVSYARVDFEYIAQPPPTAENSETSDEQGD